MHRYVFLDIDGVLNSERSVAAHGKLVHCGWVRQDMDKGKQPDPMWDEMSIRLLAKAQQKLDFRVVISSTWRYKFSVQEFNYLMGLYGWGTNGIIVGKTGDGPGPRGRQIAEWLTAHAKYPYDYCIIDDNSDMLDNQMDKFVLTHFNNGLDYESFQKIFEVFGDKYVPEYEFDILRR